MSWSYIQVRAVQAASGEGRGAGSACVWKSASSIDSASLEFANDNRVIDTMYGFLTKCL